MKIYMTEEDTLLIRLYERIFKANNFEVVFNNTGDGVISELKNMTIKPSLILLDLALPKRNGLDILKDLKEDEQTKNIPVTIFTNSDRGDYQDKALALGAVDYLVKNKYTPNQVVAKINEICNKNCQK